MTTILLVARHELMTYLRRRSFLLVTIGLPLLGLLISVLAQRGSGAAGVGGALEGLGLSPEAIRALAEQPVGVVDESGVVRSIPPYLAAHVREYPDAARGEAALRGGEIAALYLVPPDYLETGTVERVTEQFQPIAPDAQLVELLLGANLLAEADPARIVRLREPIRESLVEVENIGERAADQAGGAGGELAFWLAYLLAMLLYTTTFMSASFLLQSVATEKENRVLEILLTTTRPLPLLAGKLVGLGLLGLGQTLVWAGSAYTVARLGLIPLPLSLEGLGIGWQLGLLVLLYFVLGYTLFSTLMAGIGALVPTVRESGPMTMLVVLPAIVPLMVMTQLVEAPHGALAVTLSLIPFTAPLTMMIRLPQGGVPAWQILASVTLMALTIPLLLSLVARLFRAQTLLASAELTPRRVWEAVRAG